MKSLPFNQSLLYFFIFLCLGCNRKSDININDLDGYWEIEKVETNNQENKVYNMNTVVDFFEINSDSTGYRKKLNVHFSGNYQTNSIQQKLNIEALKQEVFIKHISEHTNWSEKIITLNSNVLILQNKNGTTYFYKRHKKLSLIE